VDDVGGLPTDQLAGFWEALRASYPVCSTVLMSMIQAKPTAARLGE
jgi:hypothetical protein